jgi:integrase
VATALDSWPPGDYTDPATVGHQLRVRVKKRGGLSRTFLLRYRWRDEWVRIVIGHRPTMTMAEARVHAQELRRAIDDGIDPRRARQSRRVRPAPQPLSAAPANADSKRTVDFLAHEFLERYVKPHRRRPEYAQAILERDVLPEWRGRDARTIKPREVVELLDKIVARGSGVMANRTAGLVDQMFRYGVHRALIDSSPVQLLYRPGGKEKPRERVLSDDELSVFLADPQDATRFDRLAHVLTLLLLTGQRRGELALARWSHIDFDAKTWAIPDENSKSGRGHIVPLSEWALAEFRALKRLAKKSSWVLPANGGEHHIDPKLLTRGLARCQERMAERGIAAFTLHDLRRTCRTGLARLKVEPHIAERVLNHAQERIPGTYDRHSYLDEKRQALDKWAAHLASVRP